MLFERCYWLDWRERAEQAFPELKALLRNANMPPIWH
jgi:hypothetical protein